MSTVVTRGDQVSPFAGHFVAYETDSLYFNTYPGGRKGYFWKPSRTRYGYVGLEEWIWRGGETGYGMGRLLFKDEPGGQCALITSVFQEFGPVFMRLATVEELKSIKNELDRGCAELELKDFISKAQMLKLVDDDIATRTWI